MLQCGEFAAWVTIEGTEAPEYGVEVSEDQKCVTCWIASEVGKKFSVHWKNTSYYDSVTRGRVYMDGTLCAGQIIRPEPLPAETTTYGIRNGSSVKPFMFSSLQLTDDDTFLGGPTHESLGLIEIKIKPVQVTEWFPICTSVRSLSNIKIHERSKKAVTQQITLAEPEAVLPKGSVKCQSTGPELVKFSFKYRPADVLRANGIIPSPPQLKRKASTELPRAEAPVTDDDDDDDAKEEKMLRERLNAIEAKRLQKNKKPRVKNEPSGDTVVDLTQDKKKKVKTESKPTFIQGEIIDLT
ncbi:hypothetical protein C8R45DRAFT_980354 [Mycena sanguinolenta]|nr:hypothetical protein C8R45DRAFT_980354 [Mycena sanguinolenta]